VNEKLDQGAPSRGIANSMLMKALFDEDFNVGRRKVKRFRLRVHRGSMKRFGVVVRCLLLHLVWGVVSARDLDIKRERSLIDRRGTEHTLASGYETMDHT
jgi:hypothetical protein